MRVLYFSVHAILEYDEIRMFQRMDCCVFPLGSYFGGHRSQSFRPEIEFDDAEFQFLMSEFNRLGGIYSPHNSYTENIIPVEFVDLFDVCIVMHEPSVIIQYWPQISRRPVIWRTIGVDTEGADESLKSYRAQGLLIVRYCPTESYSSTYLGHDRVIRFAKRSTDFHPRAVGERFCLTFSNQFSSRYPEEYGVYQKATEGIQSLLGGSGNEAEGGIGLVEYEDQLSLLSRASCYYYGHGTFIPYTLNFMEAWMAGTPMVVLNCKSVYKEERCKYAEIPSLIKNGKDGFIVSSAAEANEVMKELVHNDQLGLDIGTAGARSAKALFDEAVVGAQWRDFLEEITDRAVSGAGPVRS